MEIPASRPRKRTSVDGGFFSLAADGGNPFSHVAQHPGVFELETSEYLRCPIIHLHSPRSDPCSGAREQQQEQNKQQRAQEDEQKLAQASKWISSSLTDHGWLS
jgi:hypothetical protein